MKTPKQCHFFLSSTEQWMATGPGLDLQQAMRRMNKYGKPYNLWFVPLPSEEEYEIERYAPMVEGAAHCDTFYPKR